MAGVTNAECIIIGHFHTHSDLPGLNVRVICCPSLVGPNNFSVNNAMAYMAAQNMLVIDDKGVIDMIAQIKCNHIMN